MNQREAIVTLIEAVREQLPVLNKQQERALKIMEARAEVLRVRIEKRSQHRRCPCGERECLGVVCYECFGTAPAEAREIWQRATTLTDKRIGARGLIRHAIGRRNLLSAA